MKLLKKLLYRRFSKEEYKELQKILVQENKALLRRPQYIIGNIIVVVMIFYFMVRGFGVEDFSWLSARNVIGAIIGVLSGLIVIFLILKFSKIGFKSALWPSVFFTIWMFLFFLIVPNRSERPYNWIYFLYMGLTLIGWLCSCGSIKEHFCEKIFMSQNTEEGQSVKK